MPRPRLLATLTALVATLMVPGGARAEEAGWLDRLLTKLGASKEVDLSHGMDWGVLPGPFYNPEMGLGVGMAAVGLYKPGNAAADTQISTLNLRGFVSRAAPWALASTTPRSLPTTATASCYRARW